LRLGILDWQGEPVAAQFWFTLDGRANIFKLAYDDRHRALSAGTVLSAAMFQHALEVDGVKEIDFLAGDDAYKQDWMSARRQRVGLVATDPRTLLGLSVGLAEKARSWAAAGRAAWRR
jgi:CelD/BcsL family acetyltransferase involved in cellulose biosynthesis